MISYWMIKILNTAFVFSFGAVALWLFYKSLASGKTRRSSPHQRAERFLGIMKDGSPFITIPLRESHYLIGRATECDIPLNGHGIPLKVGEICRRDGHYAFRSFIEGVARIDGERVGREPREISPGNEIFLYNYSLKIE